MNVVDAQGGRMSYHRPMRLAVGIAAGVAGLYLALVGALYAAMRGGPESISWLMARIEGPAMRILPFRPLWTAAREGGLKTGDAAPDLELETHDRSGRVRLSSFRGARPVVLVFGSYT